MDINTTKQIINQQISELTYSFMINFKKLPPESIYERFDFTLFLPNNINLPIRLLVPNSYPFMPPIIMILIPSKHRFIDPQKLHFKHPYLNMWNKSKTLVEAVKALIDEFSKEPPETAIQGSAAPRPSLYIDMAKSVRGSQPGDPLGKAKAQLAEPPKIEEEARAAIEKLSLLELQEAVKTPELIEDIFYSLPAIQKHEEALTQFLGIIQEKSEANIAQHKQLLPLLEEAKKELNSYLYTYKEYSICQDQNEESAKKFSVERLLQTLEFMVARLQAESESMRKAMKVSTMGMGNETILKFCQDFVRVQTAIHKLTYFIERIENKKFEYSAEF